MEVRKVKIDQLKPWGQNPRLHQSELAYIVKSINHYGWTNPILVQTGTDRIIAGHGRLEAAKALGMDEVPVIYLDLDDRDADAYTVADNRLAELSEWDRSSLKDILESLDDGVFDMDLTGFDEAALEELMTAAPPEMLEGETDPDDVPAVPAEPITKPGDLIILGRHRLLCGDSTNPQHVERLIDGQKVDAVITSPPYTDQREYGIGEFDWLSLMNDVFSLMAISLSDNGHMLVNLGTSHKNRKVDMYWLPWLDYAENMGWPLYGWYIWDKGSGMPGEWNGRLAPSHEFVFHFTKAGESANKWIETQGRTDSGGSGFRQKDGTLKAPTSSDKIGQPYKVPDSVIRINREMSRGIHTQNHPAVYPVEFASFLIKTWTSQGDAVYEPFCGSGTTLIACEQDGRTGFGMELDPKYCDVIVERWEKFTGKKAQRP